MIGWIIYLIISYIFVALLLIGSILVEPVRFRKEIALFYFIFSPITFPIALGVIISELLSHTK